MRKYSRVEASGVSACTCSASPPSRATYSARRSRAGVRKAFGVICEGWCIGRNVGAAFKGADELEWKGGLRGRARLRLVFAAAAAYFSLTLAACRRAWIVSLRYWRHKIWAAELAPQSLLRTHDPAREFGADDGDVVEDLAGADPDARAQHGAADARAARDLDVLPEHALGDGRAVFDVGAHAHLHVSPFPHYE